MKKKDMLVSAKENQKFIDAVMPLNFLQEVLEWIDENMLPEDVYDVRALESWAEENDYKKDECF